MVIHSYMQAFWIEPQIYVCILSGLEIKHHIGLDIILINLASPNCTSVDHQYYFEAEWLEKSTTPNVISNFSNAIFKKK